jgi:hypothetical protein
VTLFEAQSGRVPRKTEESHDFLTYKSGGCCVSDTRRKIVTLGAVVMGNVTYIVYLYVFYIYHVFIHVCIIYLFIYLQYI